MPVINVARRFIFNYGDRREEFQPGTHEVSEEVASHWFTQAHLVGVAQPEPPPKSYEEQMELALAAVHNADPTRDVRPVERPATVADLHRPGSVSPNAVFFAGKEQYDRPLPGQEPPPLAVKYGGIPR